MNKIAVVTGARRGIGKGIADKLNEKGYTVIYSAASESMDKEIDFANSITLYNSLNVLPRYVLIDQRFWLWLHFSHISLRFGL